MILYTVDRTNKLAENMQIALTRYNDVSPQELQVHVDELFPEGFSVHGERYFLKNSSNSTSINPNIELIFEIVRQAHYEDKPSRFQSFFATETVEDAKKFSSKFGTDNDLVFEIACEGYFKADMSLLTLNNTILVESYLAHLYWKGKTCSGNPLWECLVKPPLIIKKKLGMIKNI